MAKIIPAAKARGTGRPDFSEYVQTTRRSQTFKDLQLNPGETMKEFRVVFTDQVSPFSWIKSPLAPGSSQPLIDQETGSEMPYTVLKGYEFKVLRYWASISEPAIGRFYLDGYMAGNSFYIDHGVYFEQEIEEFTTKNIDPTFSSSHTVNFMGINKGVENALGQVVLSAILIKHGSPEITSKTIVCRKCGNGKEVDLNTVQWECPKCGTLNLYFAKRSG